MVRGGIAFVHPLMRSAVAEQARAADRRTAHRRLAAVVHGPEARARHLALGAAGPDEAVAGELEAAARMAAGRGACGTAGDLPELAVTLTPLAQPESQRRRTVLAAEERFEASDPARACCLIENIIDAVPAGPARADCYGARPGIARSAVSRWRPGSPPWDVPWMRPETTPPCGPSS